MSRGRLVTRVVLAGLVLLLGTWALATVADMLLAVRLMGVALTGVLTAALVRRIPGAIVGEGDPDLPDAFDRTWGHVGTSAHLPDPPERGRMQRLVRAASRSAGDAHVRLRPTLCEVADSRLDAVYGTHLDRDPHAPARIGPTAWSWVRPDRDSPSDHLAPGITPDVLHAVLDDLERLHSTDEDLSHD